MNISHRQKQEIMNENKYLCSYDKYKNKTTSITQKYIYNPETLIPVNISFCTIDIMFADIINVAYKFYEINKFKPVLINIVDKSFNGSNIIMLNNITEPDIILRSNFYKTINNKNLYPLNEGEVTYSENVLFFRNEKYQEINNIFDISMITFALLKNPPLMGQYMLTQDYFNYQKTIEAIFQCAFIAGKDVILFSDLGVLSYGIPITELIEIINICILKYCTLFKFIIFSISPNISESNKIYDIFVNSIIKPQLFNEIINNNNNQQSLNQQPLYQQSLNQQSLYQQPLNQQSLYQQPLNQQSLYQQPLNQQSLNQSLNQQSLNQQSLNQSLNQQSLNQQPLYQQSLNQ
jgi:hypothetical protein